MASTPPLIQGNVLSYQQSDQPAHLLVNTPDWYAWLCSASTFRFQSEYGTFTARKERAGSRRGGEYWKAYRKRQGKLYRAYLGKSEELTLERLTTAALALERAGNAADGGTHRAQGVVRAPALPVPLTPLIGREQEAASVAALLRRQETRLVTLCGTAGIGKTRLAIQVAADLLEDFADGVAFVSLAPIRDSTQVLATIAHTLGLHDPGVEPGDSLRALCEVALSQDDPAAAHRCAEESLGVLREIGAREDQVASSLIRLARAQARQGNVTAARACYEESLGRAMKGGFKEELASGLEGLACVVAAQGACAWAAHLWAAATTVRDAIGVPMSPLERADDERARAAARLRLGEKAWSLAWKEGRAMTPELALATQAGVTASMQVAAPPLRSSPAFPDGLTAREVEVLRSVSQGLTDVQVADQLVISPRTVQGHLRSIYNKINVSSRGAATRYAVEHQLV